ncbi:MAG: 6-phosphofructokinase, partial [Oscillospiraceae bacterium]
GIKRGYAGLLDGDIEEMSLRSVSYILQRGGTMLFSSRCPEFKEDRSIKKAIKILCENGIDYLVVIGGDGTFKGGERLSQAGFPVIALPATIDNDIGSTEYTIGFDTAVNTVIQMVDRVRDTAQSHDRCSVIEVMGRDAGYIALDSG